MIEIKNVYKSFEKKSVLKNINIQIHKKEMVAIQGPSGAGKTTLLKLVGLLDSIDSGSILFDNNNISEFNEHQTCIFRNEEVGFVFQFHNLLPELSALENICMPSLIKNESLSNAKKNGKSLMSYLNILDKSNAQISELSGGEQQRVAIGRALINSPKLILADEPTGNLDSQQSENIFNLFKDIRNKFNTTFLIITHNNNLAKLCDRIINIEDGYII